MNVRTMCKQRVGLCTGVVVAACVIGGCASIEQPVDATGATGAVAMPAGGSGRRVVADWDDVHPAVSLMAQQVEMAMLDWSPGHRGVAAAREQRFELLTVGDEPAELVARREDGGVIELSARVGRFGDARRERALVEVVARRLEDLAGVEVRPLR
jgi:hypothetical protein